MLVLLGMLAFLLAGTVNASKLVFEDDFAGINGDPPDTAEWEVSTYDANDWVRIDNNALRTHTTSIKYAHALMKNNFSANEFTINVDVFVNTANGRTIDVRLHTDDGNGWKGMITILYDVETYGWGYVARKNGNNVNWYSNTKTGTSGIWYQVEVIVRLDHFNVTVKEKASGTVRMSKSNVPIDAFRGINRVKIGVFTTIGGRNTDSSYDNLKIYDDSAPPNIPPLWSPIPTLSAVEDIPITYNFSANVSDEDHDLLALSISTVSGYVLSTTGLEVRFLFPNGVTETTIWLVLTDGEDQVAKGVDFNITPVNDPPEHDIPGQVLAEEDIPLFMDMALNVWDIDDPLSEVHIEVDCTYVEAGRLNLTATFPEGVLEYILNFNLTDGELSVPVTITFTIAPVDDPPIVSALGEFQAVEDELSVLNISSYLYDIDTPVEDLSLIVWAVNCTVVGHELHFLYTVGDITEEVLVQVTDGKSMVDATLLVTVNPRNDAPVAHVLPPKGIEEDEAATVNVWAYVEDEDTPKDQLTIVCGHPAVIDVSGFNITLLYEVWWPEHQVNYTVTDGYLVSHGHFLVQVKAMNDPPTLTGIGDMVRPMELEMDEGTELWFDILVEDEDSSTFLYSVSSQWNGVTVFANGTLRVIALVDEVGEYFVTVSIDDGDGGTDSIDMAIVVKNVNDPPDDPVLLDPNNHTMVEEGTNITFSVDVRDPDLMYGQVLMVTWVSNVSGVIRTLTSDVELSFVTDVLPVGEHTITVKVSDGEFERTAWMRLTVLERYVPPPPEEEEPNLLTEPAGIAAILIVVVLVIVVIAILLAKNRGQGDAEEVVRVGPEPAPLTVGLDEGPSEDLAALSGELDRLATDPEEQRELEAAQAPPAPQLETLAVPEMGVVMEVSDDEMADRLHATQVRDVGKALTQLPRGLPTALWNKDLSELARDIVDGPKKAAPDGTKLVQVDGNWYSADHTNVGTFLREYKEEVTSRPSIDVDDRVKKLDQLDERLLEGKISEETYERLRKKYEGS